MEINNGLTVDKFYDEKKHSNRQENKRRKKNPSLSILYAKIPLQKKYDLEDDKISKSPFPLAKNFKSKTFGFNDIRNLYDIIAPTSEDPYAFIILGSAPQDYDNTLRNNTIFSVDDDGTFWICLDFDNINLPLGLNPVSIDAVEFLILKLPQEFHKSKYVYQFSNSAGLLNPDGTPYKSGVNVHIFFMFQHPIKLPALKQYLRDYCLAKKFLNAEGESAIDLALFNPVQYITTARPKVTSEIKSLLKESDRLGLNNQKADDFVKLPSTAYKEIDSQSAIKVFQKQSGQKHSKNIGIVKLLEKIGCIHSMHDKYITLCHKNEKSKGGSYLYYESPDFVHKSSGSEKPLYVDHWVEKYRDIERDQLISIKKELIEVEIGKFNTQTSEKSINLTNGEYISDALDDNRLKLYQNSVNLIVSPTASGKGHLLKHLVESLDEPLICVDPLIRLVKQTHSRAEKWGFHVSHYLDDDEIEAVDSEVLCCCIPSLSRNKPIVNQFVSSAENSSINLLIDEIHYSAIEFFKRNDAIYKRFINDFKYRIKTVVLSTATCTANADKFAERLAKDLGVSLKKQVVTLPKEKISAVAHTFSSNEEKIAQLDQIIEKCTGKVIIIDQSRTFLEKLDLLYKRKWPDKNFQLVTAFSKNSYSPNHDGHTLGSPSMGLGISIDEPIEYFVVCFNDFIASPDSFEQTLARLRNNVGQNRHTKIVIIVEEKSISKFKTFDEFTEELKYTWSEILSKVDHYLKSHDKQGLCKLLKEKNLSYSGFLNYQNGYHVHDPTYLEILIQSEAESRFVSYYGAKSFIQYFIRNPEKLSSIVIQSLESTITDNDVENEDNTELLEIIKEEGEKSFAEIKPCYNRKEMLTLKKQLKEPSKEGEKQELLIKHISTLKFEAKMAGGLEAKNMTSLKRALSKKFSYRVINTWLYLKSKGLEVQNTSEEQIFVELCTGKEIPAVLFQIARRIWALWTTCSANEECANKFSDLVQKYLSSLSPPELQEAFHSKSPKQLKETLGKLLKLFGIIRIKRKKSKKDDRKEYFSFVNNPEITIKNGISFSVMQTWVNSHLTGLGKLLITSKIDNISELDDVDEILKEIQAVFNGIKGGYSLFKSPINSHVPGTLPKRTFVS